MSPGAQARKAAVALALLLGVALCALPLSGHVDDSDAHLYTVLARHLAGGSGLFDLSYLPGVHPRFREHLPFGLWPFALAFRVAGDKSITALSLLLSGATLLVVFVAGARLAGFFAGLAGLLVLALTESFFHYGGLVHLDRLLLLFTIASLLPLCTLERAGPRRYALAAFFAALATLVKGPFGLLPLAALVAARSIALRSSSDVGSSRTGAPRELLAGATTLLAALVPAALFLLWNGIAGDGTWVQGYLFDQVLRSATGARLDQGRGPLPFATILGRFWPGLPFAAWAALTGLRDLFRGRRTAAALLGPLCLVLLALLWLPGRRSWHHALIAFAPLAVLAGVAAGPLLERLCEIRRRAQAALVGLAVATSAAVLAVPLGVGAHLVGTQCLVPPALVASLPRGSNVAVVAPDPDWKAIALLAAEHDLSPWPMTALPAGDALGFVGRESSQAMPLLQVALVRSDARRPSAEWREEARAGDWVLVRR